MIAGSDKASDTVGQGGGGQAARGNYTQTRLVSVTGTGMAVNQVGWQVLKYIGEGQRRAGQGVQGAGAQDRETKEGHTQLCKR